MDHPAFVFKLSDVSDVSDNVDRGALSSGYLRADRGVTIHVPSEHRYLVTTTDSAFHRTDSCVHGLHRD